MAKRLVAALDRTGHYAQQPLTWAALAAALSATGPTGRRAALRGSTCYAVAGVVGNLIIKPLVGRPRPPEARARHFGPITSSFPSGHASTDVAFAFAAAQEAPLLMVPLGITAALAHWSIVRSRGHFSSDVFLGGCLGVGVAVAVKRLWPPSRQAPDQGSLEAYPGQNNDTAVRMA